MKKDECENTLKCLQHLQLRQRTDCGGVATASCPLAPTEISWGGDSWKNVTPSICSSVSMYSFCKRNSLIHPQMLKKNTFTGDTPQSDEGEPCLRSRCYWSTVPLKNMTKYPSNLHSPALHIDEVHAHHLPYPKCPTPPQNRL